jgi:hypothetical protein
MARKLNVTKLLNQQPIVVFFLFHVGFLKRRVRREKLTRVCLPVNHLNKTEKKQIFIVPEEIAIDYLKSIKLPTCNDLYMTYIEGIAPVWISIILQKE